MVKPAESNLNLVYLPFFCLALKRFTKTRVERYTETYLPIKMKKLNAKDLLGRR